MTDLLAIDPGNTKSAWCILRDGVPVAFAKETNEDILERMASAEWCGSEPGIACIEMMAPRGMPFSDEEMRTLVWLGQFKQAWPGECFEVTRLAVKLHVCGRGNAKDANIRQALIDLYGGDSVAIGGKKCFQCKGQKTIGLAFCPVCKSRSQKNNDCSYCKGGKAKSVYIKRPCDVCCQSGWEFPPGPLHGISADVWAALGVGVTFLDARKSS